MLIYSRWPERYRWVLFHIRSVPGLAGSWIISSASPPLTTRKTVRPSNIISFICQAWWSQFIRSIVPWHLIAKSSFEIFWDKRNDYLSAFPKEYWDGPLRKEVLVAVHEFDNAVHVAEKVVKVLSHSITQKTYRIQLFLDQERAVGKRSSRSYSRLV